MTATEMFEDIRHGNAGAYVRAGEGILLGLVEWGVGSARERWHDRHPLPSGVISEPEYIDIEVFEKD